MNTLLMYRVHLALHVAGYWIGVVVYVGNRGQVRRFILLSFQFSA